MNVLRPGLTLQCAATLSFRALSVTDTTAHPPLLPDVRAFGVIGIGFAISFFASGTAPLEQINAPGNALFSLHRQKRAGIIGKYRSPPESTLPPLLPQNPRAQDSAASGYVFSSTSVFSKSQSSRSCSGLTGWLSPSSYLHLRE